MWQGILQLSDEKDFDEIPSNVKDDWIAILSEVLDKRVANIPHTDKKVKLFCELEKQNNPHKFFTNVFMVHAANSLEIMFSSDQVSPTIYNSVFN